MRTARRRYLAGGWLQRDARGFRRHVRVFATQHRAGVEPARLRPQIDMHRNRSDGVDLARRRSNSGSGTRGEQSRSRHRLCGGGSDGVRRFIAAVFERSLHAARLVAAGPRGGADWWSIDWFRSSWTIYTDAADRCSFAPCKLCPCAAVGKSVDLYINIRSCSISLSQYLLLMSSL